MKSQQQSAISILPFTESYFTLICIDNCMNKSNSSVAWKAPFSAISDAPFWAPLYRSWSATLGAILVAP